MINPSITLVLLLHFTLKYLVPYNFHITAINFKFIPGVLKKTFVFFGIIASCGECKKFYVKLYYSLTKLAQSLFVEAQLVKVVKNATYLFNSATQPIRAFSVL